MGNDDPLMNSTTKRYSSATGVGSQIWLLEMRRYILKILIRCISISSSVPLIVDSHHEVHTTIPDEDMYDWSRRPDSEQVLP
jgi:hypothetical protein